jgi:hypothetical protein
MQQQRRQHPDQRGPPPPRFDQRGPPPQGPPGQRGPPRFNQGGPPPASQHDPYRSQSLMSAPRPQMYQPPPSAYQQAPMQPTRQAAYAPPNSARTTAQGRIVPERHEDRSMSMTGGYTQDRDAHQTMSGRVIPNRRAPATDMPDTNGGPSPYSYNAPGAQTRTTSMASSTGGGDHGRSMSMASSIAPTLTPSESDASTLVQRPSRSKSIESQRPGTSAGRIRPPLVYPALISRVADCFQQ